MAEGEPTRTSEHKKGEEQLAEWLVPDPEELGKIGNPILKTEIHLLGRHGDRTTATPERLLRAHERIEDMARRGDVTIEEAGVWLARIEERHQELVGVGGLSEQEMRAEELAIQRRREIQEKEFYDRSQQTYDGFVSAEQNRARLNPEMFDVNLPYWYKILSPEAKQMLRTRINITNLAKHTEDYGMTDLDQVVGVIGIRIEREAIDYMWKEMPGFRIAMATIVHDVFEPGEDHLVISKKGYALIEHFNEYRTGLINALKDYLKKHGNGRLDNYLIASDKDKYEEAAIAAVSAADNFLYAGGAYFSGDEERAVVNTKVWTEQPRAFFMPGVKAEVKFYKNRLGKAAGRKPSLFSKEEDWGGPLGAYLRERVAHDTDFRTKFKNGEIRYFPKRLFFSLFEYTTFDEDYSKEIAPRCFGPDQAKKRRKDGLREVTLAQALTSAGRRRKVSKTFKVDTAGGPMALSLLDYDGQIDLSRIGWDDLYGKYADFRSHAVPVYKHLTSGDPKARLTGSEFVVHLNKLRDDEYLSNATDIGKRNAGRILWDEDLITAAVALAASPEGLTKGTNELVLNLEDSIYDNAVIKAMDDRIFIGMPRGFRGRLLRRLNARDITKLMTALVSDIGWDNPLSRRKTLRRAAAESYEKTVREAESLTA